MLDEEQSTEIKKQIIEQIKSWDKPEELKEKAINQVGEMSPEELEEFLVKNKLVKTSETSECPFCSIVQGKIPSYKLSENPDCIAVLEINPASKAHSIIIPKNHVKQENMPLSCFELAKKISARIKEKFSPKEIRLSTSEVLGHEFINVIPIYEGQKEERKKASPEQLKQIQDTLKIEEDVKKVEEKTPKKLEKAPVRIP